MTSRGKQRRSLVGYLPPIDEVLWKREIRDLTEEMIDELKELLGEADASNMLVNEVMARMTGILPYQKDVASVFGVTPTIVSRRLNGLIGIYDRVHIDKMMILGETEYLDSEEKRFAYTDKLRKLLTLYGVHGTTINRLIMVYINDVDYYDTEEGFYEMLRDFNFGKRRAKLLTREFFDQKVISIGRREQAYVS